MRAPTGPSECAAEVHRRSVGGEETRDDENWWAIFRSARAERAETGKHPRQAPGNLPEAVPAWWREIVGIELARRAQRCGCPFPLHAAKMASLR